MNTFRPSIDWSHELVNSPLWVLQVWVITASSLLIVRPRRWTRAWS
jgi:vitamin B12/bleomycin/antimicrobial peptide transport system ATP-binding/permease protein